MRLNLRIERLVLDGFELGGSDAGLVRDAISTELSRLLTGRQHIEPQQAGALVSLRAPDVALFTGANPVEIGAAVAGALGASLFETGGGRDA